jgi:hypothetical protein
MFASRDNQPSERMVMYGIANRRRPIGVTANVFLCLALAFGITACGDAEDLQPNPHSMDLATQAAKPMPKAAQAITITKASKKSYSFEIFYPYNLSYPTSSMANDANNLIRTLLRKLVEDGQKPHEQETEISVWALAIKPGKIGESGHQFDASERYFILATYYALSDSIDYEECIEDSDQWRSGHCS